MADCPAKVHTHFADIINSQLMSNVYSTTTNDKRRSYPDTLIPPKAWFRLRSCHSNFVASSIALFGSLSFGLWHREVIAYSAFKTASIAAEQRALRDDL